MQGNVGPMPAGQMGPGAMQMGPGPGQGMNLPPDHPQKMNQQAMGQVMQGQQQQQMNQGYGMGQMGGPTNE